MTKKTEGVLPVGKLPVELLKEILAEAPTNDARLLLGPGIGLDCAVVEPGHELLVFKTDPITFATHEIGWYAVQVNANDIATCGAIPRWMLITLLLPEKHATPTFAKAIFDQIYRACRQMNVTVIGGHTEITASFERPIVIGTMIGEVAHDQFVHPGKVRADDHLLLTKGVPIEATGLLAREFPDRLLGKTTSIQNPPGFTAYLTAEEVEEAQNFIYSPGIGVLTEAQIAITCGGVHAMHDPTEGGLYAAVWEFAEASQHSMAIEIDKVPVFPLSEKICHLLGLDPLGAIASGALLLAVAEEQSSSVQSAITRAGILCADIGRVLEPSNTPQAYAIRADGRQNKLPCPERDEIARLYESLS